MADLPTGTNATPPPLPNITQTGPVPPVPAFWSDPIQVMQRVLAIAVYDPESAAEIWRAYKNLTGH